MKNEATIYTPHLIIGSGIAGLSLALQLAKTTHVLLLTKGNLCDNNSWFAQGGIASVFDKDDSFEKHINDTILAGSGLCHENIVKLVVENGPQSIAKLIALGISFTKKSSHQDNIFPYHLTKEGGHSARRILHTDDRTGQEIISKLITEVRKSSNIKIIEHHIAIDLLTTDKYAPNFSRNRCLGTYVLDKNSLKIYQIISDHTYLCTGGHGKLYQFTSNPNSATGDGLAMGYRAGCKVANLEFMQFHPTCLFHPKARNFLLSEALRGEGGILKNTNGDSFMELYHPNGSLAPRDIVARAIDQELKKSGTDHMYLDVRHLGKKTIEGHFPTIQQTCLKFGIDIAEEMIPIVPAAHYCCGGLITNEWGETSVANLFALGEVACTGLHGANRLASNSLLEALVFANQVALRVLSKKDDPSLNITIPPWNIRNAIPNDEQVLLSHAWDEIRRVMWNYVGIVRSDKRLKRALDKITALCQELDEYYWAYHLTSNLIEARNLAQVALLTVRCAMTRKESRGIHYNIDYPNSNEKTTDTIII